MSPVPALVLAAAAGATACTGSVPVNPTKIDARVDAAAAGGADAAPDAPTAAGPMIVYVGTGSGPIARFTVGTNLALTAAGTTTTGAGPSFLAFDPARRWLVTVNETANAVESYAMAAGTGALTRIDGTSSQGAGPAHLSLDRSGAYVMVANYGDGTAAVLPIGADGHFGAPTAMVAPGKNAHEILTDAANAVAYVPCLGTDRVQVYAFDATKGTLAAQSAGIAPTGSGPRHLAFAPDGKHLWVANETGSSITRYAIGAGGALTAAETISSRAAGATGTNTAAEIALHPSGKWLYVSNRGDDDIGVFSVASDGTLTAIDHTKTGGTTPRHFSLVVDASVPGGAAILVANQGDGTVTGLTIDPTAGTLTGLGVLANVASAEFVMAVHVR